MAPVQSFAKVVMDVSGDTDEADGGLAEQILVMKVSKLNSEALITLMTCVSASENVLEMLVIVWGTVMQERRPPS